MNPLMVIASVLWIWQRKSSHGDLFTCGKGESVYPAPQKGGKVKPIELAEILLDLEGNVDVAYSRYNGGEEECGITDPIIIIEDGFVTICPDMYFVILDTLLEAMPNMSPTEATKLIDKERATGIIDLRKENNK